ncbi:uncharacterized protein LOC127481887 [Manacus candei]|uniref:uncharacterized protein LOC127481887 n=1 Tax=Manacus candei TaxID=415023 RepID=UPI002227BF14|nr:uncharacterized protein LOC127481887 [Manacus candei]
MAGQLGGTPRPRAVRLMQAQAAGMGCWPVSLMPHSSGSDRAGTCPSPGRGGPGQGPPSRWGSRPSCLALHTNKQPMGTAVSEVGHRGVQGRMPPHARGRSDARAVLACATVRDTPGPCLFGVRNFLAASDGWLRSRNASLGPEISPPGVNALPPPSPPPPSRHDLMLFMFFGNCVSAEKPRRAPSSAAQLYCGELRHSRSESITPRSYNTGLCGYPLIYI